MNIEDLSETTEFEWDSGNYEKILRTHGVTHSEAEEVFFNEPQLLFDDIKHSQNEPRQYCFGQSDAERKLFIVFTLRKNKIRIISARDMSRKERHYYEKA